MTSELPSHIELHRDAAPVPYRAEFTFSVTQETAATIVLQEDMPADNANPREVSVPVGLVPAG